MKTTDYTFNNKSISYVVTEDGYDIYLGGEKWIGQHGQYDKPVDKSKSYEENCLAQIEEICTPTEPAKDEISGLKAQIEYMAMMTDIDLTSVTGGEE